MCWLYSTKPGSGRLQFQVFCNMLRLDIAEINSHTVFKLANNSCRQSRRHFLLQLVNELVAGHRAKATSQPLLGKEVLQQMQSTCVREMCHTNAHLSSLVSFWPLNTSLLSNANAAALVSYTESFCLFILVIQFWIFSFSFIICIAHSWH